jgi:transposase
MQPQKISFTETEAAELVGLSVDTLRSWRSRSRTTGHLIGPRWTQLGGRAGTGRLVRYRLADLEAWLESGLTSLQPKKRRGRPRGSAVADTAEKEMAVTVVAPRGDA